MQTISSAFRLLRLLVGTGLLAGIVLTPTTAALAQGNPTEPAKDEDPLKDVVITKVFTTNPPAEGEYARARINDRIRVRLENLDKATAVDKNKLVLFLDGLQMKGLYGVPVESAGNELEYHLKRDASPEGKEAWTALLGSPSSYEKPVTVSVGIEGAAPVSPEKGKRLPRFTLIVLSKVWSIISALALLASLVLFWYLAKHTNIIRDSGPPKPPEGKMRPYSLARVQMAVWFFMVIGSFVFIYLITNDYDTITEQALILIGIGTGTALGSAVIDANKRNSSDSQLGDLLPAQAKLKAEIAELQKAQADLTARIAAAPPGSADDQAVLKTTNIDLADKQAQLTETDKKIEAAEAGLSKPVSEGPVRDMLTDANGVSFHRFQMLMWTVVLVFLFVIGVYKALAMPAFSNTLLALMGISSGTYLGFKIPEQQRS